MPPEEYTRFCSVFDTRDTMDDLKLEEIKKRVEALVLAYKMRKDIKEVL